MSAVAVRCELDRVAVCPICQEEERGTVMMETPEEFEPESPTLFYNERTKKMQRCRIEDFNHDDPITQMSGCGDEILNDMRKRDIREGCPACLSSVEENGSEPDVRARWGLPVVGAILLLLSTLTASAQERTSPVLRIHSVVAPPVLPWCGPELGIGTACLWQAQAQQPAVCPPPAGNAFPVRLFDATGQQQVTGTIYLILPAGHEFRDINWKIALDISDGPACPDIVENNVALSGFASISIECAP